MRNDNGRKTTATNTISDSDLPLKLKINGRNHIPANVGNFVVKPRHSIGASVPDKSNKSSFKIAIENGIVAPLLFGQWPRSAFTHRGNFSFSSFFFFFYVPPQRFQSQGQGPLIRVRDPRSEPGTLDQGQGPSIRAGDP